MIETLFGVIGASCFALCALPQVLKAWRTRSAKDISWGFIALSFGGNIASFVYIFMTNLKTGYWQYPQFVNYSIALGLLCVLSILKLIYDLEDAIKQLL